MTKHWSEALFCPHCGKTFRSALAEAKHRHNFPLLCKKPSASYRRAASPNRRSPRPASRAYRP